MIRGSLFSSPYIPPTHPIHSYPHPSHPLTPPPIPSTPIPHPSHPFTLSPTYPLNPPHPSLPTVKPTSKTQLPSDFWSKIGFLILSIVNQVINFKLCLPSPTDKHKGRTLVMALPPKSGTLNADIIATHVQQNELQWNSSQRTFLKYNLANW